MLDTKSDLLQIADGTQHVTLRRPGTNYQVRIEMALPRISRRTSYTTSGSQTVPSHNATWNVSQSALQERPQDGDELVTQDGTVWTIYRVAISAAHQMWRLIARSEFVQFKLDEYVNILRAFAVTSEDGSPIGTEWRAWKNKVSCKFSYDQMVIDTKEESLPSERTVRVYFKEKHGVLKTDIIERPDGTQYKIRRIRFSRYTYGWTELFLVMNEQ